MPWPPAIDFFRMAIACSSKGEVSAIGGDAVGGLPFQRAQAILGGAGVAQEAAADTRNIEHIVNVGFPIAGRPIDSLGDYGGDALRCAIGCHHVEGFGVAGLEEKVHVPYSFAEEGPRLPAVLH